MLDDDVRRRRGLVANHDREAAGIERDALSDGQRVTQAVVDLQAAEVDSRAGRVVDLDPLSLARGRVGHDLGDDQIA